MLAGLYHGVREEYLAKIALELKQALARRLADGTGGGPTARVLAHGDGWSASDLMCTSGPQDRAFEEQHPEVRIAVVAAGSFQYRAAAGSELMTPGSLLLGSHGQYFQCSHEYGAGDRCVAFGYSPDYFSKLAADAAGPYPTVEFRMLRLPAFRASAPLVGRVCASLSGSAAGHLRISWEELSIQVAALAAQLARGVLSGPSPSTNAVERVTRAVRMIDSATDADFTLASLAREAGLSRYHFLRVFERLTALTPHQYLIRARLREAAIRLVTEPARVIDIALGCGFGDVSNFNRAFRAEFGASPRIYRRQIDMPCHLTDSH
jgi:AraC-like DNA-binding protein